MTEKSSGGVDEQQNDTLEKIDDISARRPVYHPPERVVRPKIGRNVLGCFLYAIFALAAISAIVMVAVAKSGIVAVPLISKWYVGPRPTRTVEAGTEKPEELLGAVRTAIEQGGTAERVQHVVSYSESELTAAVRGALAEAEKRGDVQTGSAQIVVRPDAVQLTGRFRIKGIMADALIEFLPSAENGVMKLKITKAKFGDLPVAPALAKVALDSALGRDSSQWNLNIADHEIKGVTLKDRMLEITLF
jgi:hypothetical protein